MAFPQQILAITTDLTVASGVDIVSGTLAFGGSTDITLSRSGKVRVLVAVSGTGSEMTIRNNGNDLPVFSNSILNNNILQVGEFPWSGGDSFNLRLTRGGTIRKLLLHFFAEE